MNTFEYKTERIVGLNCPAKLLVSINNIKNKIKEAVLQQGGN